MVTRSPQPRRVPSPRTVAPVLLAAAFGTVLGTLLPGSPEGRVTWQTGTASVTGQQATIEAAGWTYGIAGAVSEWVDGTGTRHQLSWPECVGALDGGDGELRFGWASYRGDEDAGRVVVAVDCR